MNDILNILNDIIEEIEKNEKICFDCSINDSTVKLNVDLYLCDQCSLKRHEDAKKIFNDLQNLAEEVEQRLQAIENTERELDQWRDQQLQKNRDFWDGIFYLYFYLIFSFLFLIIEYRRQVENFSSSRIRNLQYSYRMKQMKSEQILKRLKRAKYLYENFDKFDDQLNDFIKPELIHLIYSEEFQLVLFNSDFNSSLSSTFHLPNEIFQQLQDLDFITFQNEDFYFNEFIQK